MVINTKNFNPANEPREIRAAGDDFEPADLIRSWSDRFGRVWLDSSQTEYGGRYSFLSHSPDFILRGNLRHDRKLDKFLEANLRDLTDLPFSTGALIGSIDYDGSYQFGFYPKLWVFDHTAAVGWSNSPSPAPSGHLGPGALPFELNLQPTVTPEAYQDSVRRAQEYIAAGDIYQVCLAYPHRGTFEGKPLDFYEAWRTVSPAPFGAFVEQEDRCLLSASPECFLKINGRHILTRPIKGTRPRRRDPDEDRRMAYELQTSAKEISELVMITDLERNDLGRVCETGSITVSDLIKLETFPHVFHLVSTIEGRLRPEISHVEALRSCFPGGSISGAPKKRACEILADLESAPRGIFTGAIGYFGLNGESSFNIAIRTLNLQGKQAEYWTGAGIVADSEPEAEWQETLHKAEGLLQTVRRAAKHRGGIANEVPENLGAGLTPGIDQAAGLD